MCIRDRNGNEVIEMGGNWYEKSVAAHLYFTQAYALSTRLWTGALVVLLCYIAAWAMHHFRCRQSRCSHSSEICTTIFCKKKVKARYFLVHREFLKQPYT